MADKTTSPLVKNKNKIEKITSDILKLIGLDNFSLKSDIDKNGWYYLAINTDKQGLLIGRNGETLRSLQLILRLLLYRQLDQWVPLVLDVDGYLDKRQESLEKMAQNFSQKVKFSKQEQELPSLSAAERRIIHMYLKDNPDVITESVDTNFGRKLIIKPRN